MDEQIPSRHRKKYRKNNSKNTEAETVPEETSKQFSKRELLNNWNKYDDKTPSNVMDAPNSSDFEELLMAPVSIGGHFLFNSEKSWEAKDDWYNREEYFQLNLTELSKSLATIPFYERQNYPKNIFSSQEIEDMNRQASQHLKWSMNNRNASSSGTTVDRKCDGNKTETAVHPPENDDDDLDELLSLTGTKREKIHNPENPYNNKSNVSNVQFGVTSSADSTDDIQKWLDDVLVLDS